MIYSKPEFIIMYNSEIEQMIKANASPAVDIFVW